MAGREDRRRAFKHPALTQPWPPAPWPAAASISSASLCETMKLTGRVRLLSICLSFPESKTRQGALPKQVYSQLTANRRRKSVDYFQSSTEVELKSSKKALKGGPPWDYPSIHIHHMSSDSRAQFRLLIIEMHRS